MPYGCISDCSISIRRWLLPFALFAAGAGQAGCTVTTSPDASVGAFTVNWTIAEAASPASCTNYGAATILVHVYDVNGVQTNAGYTQSCSLFAMTIQGLSAQAYSFDAVLLDPNGVAVTTVLGRTAVSVVSGTTASVAIDFPATSFLSSQQGATTGFLTVTWDIDGMMDPALCAAHNVDSIRFRISDASGTVIGQETVEPCTAFTATVPYPTGVYTLGAELYLGPTVRTTSATATVNIVPATTVTQPVTFASSSFYM
jgi:hypothetical protein